MSVEVQASEKEEVITIRVQGEFNAESARICFKSYCEIHRAWWKKVVVILEHTNEIDLNAMDLLFFLRERTRGTGIELQLLNCGIKIHRLIEGDAFKNFFQVITPKVIPLELNRVSSR